jgi:hypothetical protein
VTAHRLENNLESIQIITITLAYLSAFNLFYGLLALSPCFCGAIYMQKSTIIEFLMRSLYTM